MDPYFLLPSVTILALAVAGYVLLRSETVFLTRIFPAALLAAPFQIATDYVLNRLGFFQYTTFQIKILESAEYAAPVRALLLIVFLTIGWALTKKFSLLTAGLLTGFIASGSIVAFYIMPIVAAGLMSFSAERMLQGIAFFEHTGEFLLFAGLTPATKFLETSHGKSILIFGILGGIYSVAVFVGAAFFLG